MGALTGQQLLYKSSSSRSSERTGSPSIPFIFMKILTFVQDKQQIRNKLKTNKEVTCLTWSTSQPGSSKPVDAVSIFLEEAL